MISENRDGRIPPGMDMQPINSPAKPETTKRDTGGVPTEVEALIKRLVNDYEVKMRNDGLSEELYQVGAEAYFKILKNQEARPQGNEWIYYLEIRIGGAMKDFLRTFDPLKTRQRRKMNKVNAARHLLEGTLGRTPNNTELAAAMGITKDELFKMEQIRRPQMVSTDDEPEEGHLGAYDVPDPKTANLEHSLNEAILTKEILALVETKLTGTEHIVFSLYYINNCTLKEIGNVLDLTEGRISQIMKKIKEKLEKLGVNIDANRSV